MCHRSERVGELEPRCLDFLRITTEVARDLLPSLIKSVSDGLQGLGSQRHVTDELCVLSSHLTR